MAVVLSYDGDHSLDASPPGVIRRVAGVVLKSMAAANLLVAHVVSASGHGDDHNLALLGLLWLPLLFVLVGRGLQRAARRHDGVAATMVTVWQSGGPRTRTSLRLIAATAVIHLALIPAHLADTATAMMFAADTVALIAVIAAALLEVPWWRAAALTLLAAAVIAYALYLVAGWESPDGIGFATKAVELVTMGLLTRGKEKAARRIAGPLWSSEKVSGLSRSSSRA